MPVIFSSDCYLHVTIETNLVDNYLVFMDQCLVLHSSFWIMINSLFLRLFYEFLFYPRYFPVHTMEELKLTGNHLKGSRPLLTFSSNFEKDAHWKLLKEMLLQVLVWCFVLVWIAGVIKNCLICTFLLFIWSCSVVVTCYTS